jgi:hypothetical protein
MAEAFGGKICDIFSSLAFGFLWYLLCLAVSKYPFLVTHLLFYLNDACFQVKSMS